MYGNLGNVDNWPMTTIVYISTLVCAVSLICNLRLNSWKIDLSALFLLILMISVPIKWIGSINGYYYTLNSFQTINSVSLTSSILLFNLFVVIYFTSYLFVIRYFKDVNIKNNDNVYGYRFNKFITVSVFFLPGIILLVYKLKQTGFDGDYFKMLRTIEEETRVGGGLGTLLTFSYFFCAPLLFVLYSKVSGYKLIVALVLFSLMGFFYTGTKHLCLIPVFMHFCNQYVIQKKNINIRSMLVYSSVILTLIAIIPYTRTEHPEYVTSILQLFFFAFDSGDNYLFVFDNVKDKLTGDLGGTYFFDTIVYSFIPRSLFPDKREIYGFQEIQRDYLPHLFLGASGETVSVSITGEAVVTLGFFGIVLAAMMLGTFLGFCQKGVFKSYSSVIILVVSAYIFEIIRGGTRSINLIIILASISFLLRYILFNKSNYKISSNYIS